MEKTQGLLDKNYVKTRDGKDRVWGSVLQIKTTRPQNPDFFRDLECVPVWFRVIVYVRKIHNS